ncbi:hypothetical protein MMC08_007642 [Hypocenomyce scalaris]|nr:hypothetical protein [Hypocenomyce scalaris]
MDDVQQPARPQPNFPAMTQHLAAFIDEFQHCMNIPAVEGGVAIAEALGSINRAMVELRQEVRNGFQRIETRFTRLEAMIAAEQSNSVARVINSTATCGNGELQPLVGSNNVAIDGFPGTPDAIRNLPTAEARRILTLLGVNAQGTVAQIRRRLLLHAGVVNESRLAPAHK